MKLSVITVNLNNCSGLEKTMESIIGQTFQDFEWIVIDGGSSDNSVDLLEQNSQHIDFCVSEKDAGIYNAMNKGVSHAKGEYLIFMNSGDYFADKDVLKDVLNFGLDDDIVYGDFLLERGGKIVGRKIHKQLSFQLIFTSTICHQASFIRRQLLLETPYNETYKIVSDYEFWLKMVFDCKKFTHVDRYVCVSNREGLSITNVELNRRERQSAMINNIPESVMRDYSLSGVRRLIPLWDRHKILRKGVTFFIMIMEFLDRIRDKD